MVYTSHEAATMYIYRARGSGSRCDPVVNLVLRSFRFIYIIINNLRKIY